jgi:hypothetical protein
VEEEGDKVEMLIRTFFLPQPEPEARLEDTPVEGNDNSSDLVHNPIQEKEVWEAIFSSNPRKAPGPDEIPFRV